jgi:hypothetical protein
MRTMDAKSFTAWTVLVKPGKIAALILRASLLTRGKLTD